MGVRFILGPSGAGKTRYLYKEIIDKAEANPQKNYIIVVPEQFTMAVQRDIVTMHPRHGVMNIDIVSFNRLAFRVFEELGINKLSILDDTGKTLVLRHVIEDKKKELKLFKDKLKYFGFVEEMKSSISELYQYGISPDDLESIVREAKGHKSTMMKLDDIRVIYEGFKEYVKNMSGDDNVYITKEEVLSGLCEAVKASEIIKNSEIYLDGFTGFTPVQNRLIQLLMEYSKGVNITLAIDACECNSLTSTGFVDVKEHELFAMSKTTVNTLISLAADKRVQIEKPVIIDMHDMSRFKENDVLLHIEKNLFRYNEIKTIKSNDTIGIYVADNPLKEAEFISDKIASMIMESNGTLRYRDIAIVTGDLENARGNIERALKSNDIPYFMDSKRSLIRNPFVGIIRSVLQMADEDFSYESVFSYLKNEFSPIETEAVDVFENYVLGCGIRGASQYSSPFIKKYKDMKDEELEFCESVRERLLEAIGEFFDECLSKSKISDAGNMNVSESKSKISDAGNMNVSESKSKISDAGNMNVSESKSKISDAGNMNVSESESKISDTDNMNVSESKTQIVDTNNSKVSQLEENSGVSISNKKLSNNAFKGLKVREITQKLRAFIEKHDLVSKLTQRQEHFKEQGEHSLAAEYGQTYELTVELFDKLDSLLGEEELTLKEYRRLLDDGFLEIKVGIIPMVMDQVVVGDIQRTRLNSIKVLFVMNVNDGVIPSHGGKPGLLSQSDRTVLKNLNMELSPTLREAGFIQRFYLYLNLTKPSEKLIMTYALSSCDGNGIRPSYLIGVMQDMFEGLDIKLCKNEYATEGKQGGIITKRRAFDKTVKGIKEYGDEETNLLWRELISYFGRSDKYREALDRAIEGAFFTNIDNVLEKAVAKALYGDKLTGSITRIENYAACAYAHFLNYGLKLMERPVYEIKPVDIGNIFHEAIELFSREIVDRNIDFSDVSDDMKKDIVDDVVQKVTEKYGGHVLRSTARNEYMIEKIRRVTDRSAWAIIEHIKRGGFKPDDFELKLREGRIDRVDRLVEDDNVYIKVIDYKSGSKTFSPSDVENGLQLQLIYYMDTLVKREKAQHADKNVHPGEFFILI